tara:strand:- start:1623 stop:3338 length:1716 start_codon:yes stop_codon:yes gene_type:complete
MPKQKLIRLTSDTQDGIFSSMFNEDILISKDSDIALQSLSVERKSDKIVISNDNNNIEYGVVLPELGIESTIIPSGVYDKNTNNRLLQSITNGLNRDASFTVDSEQMGTEWNVEVENGYTVVKGTTMPFFPINVWNATTGEGIKNTVSNYSSPVQNNIVDGEYIDITIDGLSRQTTTTTGNANEAFVFGGYVPFVKSTGSLRLRLAKLFPDVLNDKAFTFGLMGKAAVEKCHDGTITEADLTYAIRVKQPNATSDVFMQLKNGIAGSFVDTTAVPLNYDAATIADNDIVEIVINSGRIYGQHWNLGGSNVFDYYNTTDGEDLFWGIFIFDSNATCIVDKVAVSMGSTIVSNIGGGGGANETEISEIIINNPQLATDPESNVTGYVEFERNVRDTPSFLVEKDVFDHLGFENTIVLVSEGSGETSGVPIKRGTVRNLVDPVSQLQYDYRFVFQWTATSIFDNSYSSDMYLIDSQTFQLDSYDSYGLSVNQRNANTGGSRRNILATIPISEVPISGTANGLIQYEPSNLFYIAIKNRGDITTRQLRFRLLTGTYEPVLTSGLASMTILIRDGY